MTKNNDVKSSPARKSSRVGPKAASALIAERMAANKAAHVPKVAAIFHSHTKGVAPPRESPAKTMTMGIAKNATRDTSSDVAMETTATQNDTMTTSTSEEDTGTAASYKNVNKHQYNKKDTKKTTKKNINNKNNGTVREYEAGTEETKDPEAGNDTETVINLVDEEEKAEEEAKDDTMSDDDSTGEVIPVDPAMVAAAAKAKAALAASEQRKAVLAAAAKAIQAPIVSKKFHFEVQTTLHGSDEASLEEEIRKAIDRITGIARTNNITISLLPLHDPDGPAIKLMSNPSSAKITFKATDDKAKKALPKFASYTNGWIKKPKEYQFTNIPLHAQINCGIEQFVSIMSMKLVAKGMNLYPYKLNTFNESDYRGIGLLLPAYQAVDHYNLSFFFLHKHDIYIDFKPVKRNFGVDDKRNEVDNGFSVSKFKDSGCVGYLLICEPHATRKVMDLVKQYFPTRTRESVDDYPCHIKLSVFLLDGSGRMNNTTLSKISNLFTMLQRDYEHSRAKPPQGGLLTKKLIANIDSLHVLIKDKQGNSTSLRKFLMSRIDPISKKARFGAISPAPTSGNKGSCLTQFTTYRSGDDKRTSDVAERASQYTSLQMCQALWDHFDLEVLDKVLAPVLLDNLAMNSAVVLADLPDSFADNEFLDEVIEEVDLRSMDSRLAPSVSSELTGATGKTTQSTRDKLSVAQSVIDALKKEIAATKAAVAQAAGDTVTDPAPPADPVQPEKSSDQPSSAEMPPEKDLIAEEPPDDSVQDSASADLTDATTCASAATPAAGNG